MSKITLKELEEKKAKGICPEWLSLPGYKTLRAGYLADGEEPLKMYQRIVQTYINYGGTSPHTLMDMLWKNHLCPASPVLSNFGVSTRGAPISCFGSVMVPDSVSGILDSMKEISMQSKLGGGTSIYMGNVRPRGSYITGGGSSEGVIPFLKMFDSTILGVSQGGVRRGALAAYLPIEHDDIEDFIDMRRFTVEEHLQVPNLHHGVCISNNFMERLLEGNEKERRIWLKLIKARLETGEPYIFFNEAANKHSKDKVYASNLCAEIFLPSDNEHTFICCLSSLNLEHYREFTPETYRVAMEFLSTVLDDFIYRGVIKDGKIREGLEKAVNHAKKYRAVGLGVLGWHSLLQKEGIPFESFSAMQLNNQIFKEIDSHTQEPAKQHGLQYRLAVAPTVSNSLISGHASSGIEPIAANTYQSNNAKGTFIYRNKYLKNLLRRKGQHTAEVWQDILAHEGSVQHLDFLTDEEKAIFKTAREINMMTVIQQASQRQQYIDQGQSINLYFPRNAPLHYINDVHVKAWELGLKSLYYCRTASALTGKATINLGECLLCQG